MTKRVRSPLFIGTAIVLLLLALIVLLVIFSRQVVTISNRIQQRNETVMSAVRDNASTLDFLKQNLALLAQDSNSARETLNLPVRDYPVLRAPAPQEASAADSRELYLNGLETILRERNKLASQEQIAKLLASPVFAGVERDHRLDRVKLDDRTLVLEKEGRRYFTIQVDPVTRNYHISDYVGSELTQAAIDERFARFVEARVPVLDKHYDRVELELARFAEVPRLASIREFALRNELTISGPLPNDIGYSLRAERAGVTLLTATLDTRTLSVTAGDHDYQSVAAFAAGFTADLQRLDLSELAKMRVESANRQIASLQRDTSFRLALSAHEIRFHAAPRQDIDYYYYDFTDRSGVRIGSFAVQKKLGMVYLMDSQDVPIKALTSLTVAPLDAPKKKP